MRTRNWLLAIVAALGVTALYSMQDTVSAQSGSGIVISEFRFRGPLGVNDEFIELFNAGTVPVNVGGWLVRASNNVQPPGFFTRATIPANTVINPGCYYLVTNVAAGGFSGGITPNLTYSIGFADDGGVALTTSSSSVIVDQVGQGTVLAAYGEGQRLPMVNTNVNRGLERRPGGTLGHLDTNDNFTDFGEINPANPQNSNTCIVTQVYLPHEIQGAGAVSPIATGTSVTVRGVVTARKSNGFFIQTEAGAEDGDEATSEGLFVSATGSALAGAVVGHSVRVSGVVSEVTPDTGSATVTQVTSVVSITDLGVTGLPAPFALSSTELAAAGSLDQLERLEGMRVTAASLTTVSGSDSGAFYAVLTGQARTFREPGVSAGASVPVCAVPPCSIPIFDADPERLRVDSDALEGVAATALTSGAIVTNVTGPLDYANHTYTLLPELVLSVSGGTSTSAANAALANEFTVSSFVLGAPFAAQTAKASLLVRGTLGMPDILFVQEASDAALATLAAAIDADASAAGQLPPQYAVASGFLLKQAGGRVTMLSIEPVGPDPQSPLALRATVSAPSQLPQTITVIGSHIDAFDSSAAALATRQAQAESLASYIQFRQSNDPSESLVALGNYSTHRFNDGYADIVGTVLGTPATPDQVAIEAHDLVSPDLLSAADSLDPSQRYTAVVNGHAQVFDHVLMTAAFSSQFAGLAYPRVNADFADVSRNDASIPNRVSDRDPVVAYFTFPPDVTAPVFDVAPSDQIAEATGPDGAVVNFAVPAATDNLDAVVSVTCAPASGSVFALGNSTVTCSADDVAGNHLEASFTVTVADTTAPTITVPGTITVEATSTAGAVVNFTVSASDLVTASPVFGCSRPSGSTFKIGTTSNTCYAFDEAGNGVTTSFLVIVTQPVAGRMNGSGEIMNGAVRTSFSFSVRQTSTFSDRGSVSLLIRGGAGRPDRTFTAAVTDVRMVADSSVFSGAGELNGMPGYRVDITAQDRGEPGVGFDRFTVKVFAPDGVMVESGSGALRSGNIQLLR